MQRSAKPFFTSLNLVVASLSIIKIKNKMKNVNDAKFIKGLVNDQLDRELFTRLKFANVTTVNGEYVVDFSVVTVTKTINELIEDVQNIAKCECIVVKNFNSTDVRFF